MIDKENIREFVVGNILFPSSSYLLNRKGIIQKYKELLRSDRYPEEKLREMQLRKLKAVLEYAYNFVPYYKRVFKSAGFLPGDVKRLEDVKALPPLGRQDVIEYRREMVDYRYDESIKFADSSKRGAGEPIQFARFRKHRLVKNTSSGSTGAPTIFYEDGSVTALNWANELRMRSWFGVKPGVKEMRMARISTEFMPGSRSLLIRKALWNQMMLPGTNLADPEYKLSYQQVKQFKPKVFWGFTSALYGLADYIERNGLDVSDMRPQLIIAWAAPLYDFEKKKLKKVFDCHVTNIYGAREVGHVAGFCPHDSLHINQESYLVETAEQNGNDREAETGEIIVTNLDITPMPFIRYRMGDLGEVSSSQCSCGRTLQIFSKFLGRTGEVYQTKDGRMIAPNFWCRTFMNDLIASSFKRFQVIYKRDGDIRIKLVKQKSDVSEGESFLREFFRKNFHADIGLEIMYVDEIKPQISGKYQMVVNEAKQCSSV